MNWSKLLAEWCKVYGKSRWLLSWEPSKQELPSIPATTMHNTCSFKLGTVGPSNKNFATPHQRWYVSKIFSNVTKTTVNQSIVKIWISNTSVLWFDDRLRGPVLNSVAKQCLQANALQTAPKPRLETWEFQKLLFFKINKIPWQRGFVSSNSTPFSHTFKGKLSALKEAVSNMRKLQDYMSCNLNLIFIFVWPKWHVCFLRNIKLYRIIELHSKSCYSLFS